MLLGKLCRQNRPLAVIGADGECANEKSRAL
jgi:hypothetical protein